MLTVTALSALTIFQRLPDLHRVSRQVEVGVVGLQVPYGAVPTRHTETLDEQLYGGR